MLWNCSLKQRRIPHDIINYVIGNPPVRERMAARWSSFWHHFENQNSIRTWKLKWKSTANTVLAEGWDPRVPNRLLRMHDTRGPGRTSHHSLVIVYRLRSCDADSSHAIECRVSMVATFLSSGLLVQQFWFTKWTKCTFAISPLRWDAQWCTWWRHWNVHHCVRNTFSHHAVAISAEIIHIEGNEDLCWPNSLQVMVDDAWKYHSLSQNDCINEMRSWQILL